MVIDVGSILGPKLGPCWPLYRNKTPSRHTKKALKFVPTLKTARNASWTRPGNLQTSILAPLDLHFAPQDVDCDVHRPRFLNVLGCFRRCLDVLRSLWTRSDAFGRVRMCSDTFGYNRIHSEAFGLFSKNSFFYVFALVLDSFGRRFYKKLLSRHNMKIITTSNDPYPL